MNRFFVAVLISLSLLPVALAASCMDNGVCEPAEVALGCADCSFGVTESVCVNDGACTYAEKSAGCDDCRTKQVPVVQEEEPSTGISDSTGLITLGAGALAVVVGFLFIVAVAVFTIYSMKRWDRRRIRL
jgi:hypothetical protein